MDERGFVGLVARTEEGEEVGRISGVLADEETGAATHFVIERGEETLEIPVGAVEADEDADFAIFHADLSDAEPGDHVGDEETTEGYAPNEDGLVDVPVADAEDEGQFVTVPEEEDEEVSPEELVREDWQDEADTPDSGYPRNDAYVDPDTGDTDVDPAMKDNESVEDDVDDLLELLSDTEVEVVSSAEGVVALAGTVESREDLTALTDEILGLDGILEVDTTDVDVG